MAYFWSRFFDKKNMGYNIGGELGLKFGQMVCSAQKISFQKNFSFKLSEIEIEIVPTVRKLFSFSLYP